MSGYFIVFLVVQIVSAFAIIILTLLQQGKGADMGAAFGSGSAGSVFGSSGSANFLSRMTSTAATIFFVTTLAMAYLSSQEVGLGASSVADTVVEQQTSIPTTEMAPESSTTESIDQIPLN